MKKLFLILLFIPIVSYGQDLNKESNGYTEVVEVKLSKKEIHQKINEWIAINYKSAQDVVQLNTEDKVIVKGNFSFTSFISGDTFGVRNTLTLSVRDNKYKIDLVPSSIFDKSTMKDVPKTNITQYMIGIRTYEEFKIFARKNFITLMMNQGYSEKRSIKLMEKTMTEEDLNDLYLKKEKTFIDFNNNIKSFFQSIKNYVNSSNTDDDW
jgi:hypothetical protein